MNRNVVKYIAIIAMTFDHIAAYIPNINPKLYLIFRMIGRIAFPVMCFFICEGFKYTRDKRKYFLRLLFLAIISQIPWTLLHENTIFTYKLFTNLNTIFTLLLGLSLLFVIESDIKLVYKSLFIISIFALSYLCDYKIIGLIIILFFYLLSDSKYKFLLLPLLYLLVIPLSIFVYQLEGVNLVMHILTNIGLFLTIPILYLYNHKSGSKHLIHKYSFYVYYPLHMLILFLVIGLF